MQFKRVGRLGGILLFSMLILASYSTPLFAQTGIKSSPVSPVQNICADWQRNSNSGTLAPLPQDSYSVYLQLAKQGQHATVTVYSDELENGRCESIGTVDANGDGWTKVGDWSAPSTLESGAKFILSSEQLEAPVDANRSTIMLVSNTRPTCTPNPTCQVSIEGQIGTILPPANSIASNALRVMRVVPPEADTIMQVTYYVNERPVYTTRQLKTFDLRYVSYSQQRTVSVVEYASGQRISLEQQTPPSHNDSFFNYLFRLYQTYPELIATIGIITALWLLSVLIFSIIHVFERRHDWRVAHGLVKEKTPENDHVISYDEYSRREHVKKIAGKFSAIIGLVILVVVTSVGFNRYIATLFTVDGPSMTEAYKHGNEVLIDRLPVTLANIAGRDFVPQRGEVVILRATYGFMQPNQTTSREFIIKRVIGLPGERVVVKDGVVSVYQADGTVINPDANSSWQSSTPNDANIENLDVKLAENELFVLGDNRSESLDSRFNGAIQANQLVGLVTWKLW